jgi:hypothetical protein
MSIQQPTSEGGHQHNLRVDRLFDKIISEKKTAEQVQNGARLEYRQALDINAEILHIEDPLLLEETAQRLEQRHNEHLVSEKFIQVMLQISELKNEGNLEGVAQLLRPFREKAKESGFFLMHYNAEIMRERLQSPLYVIGESSGKHPDNPGLGMVKAADCQCELPEAKSKEDGCEPVMEMPNVRVGDIIIEDEIVKQLIDRPEKIAEVKDIVTSLSMNKLRLAGAARSTAFRKIKQDINPTRGKYAIERIGASIAQIKGIELPDGQQILLADVKQDNIKNERSVEAHFNGTNAAVLAYILKNRKVPVNIDGVDYNIIVNWLTFFHNLNA